MINDNFYNFLHTEINHENLIAWYNYALNISRSPLDRKTLNQLKNVSKQWVKQELTQSFAPSEEQQYDQSCNIFKAACVSGCLAIFSLTPPSIMLLQLYSLFKLTALTYHLCQEDIDGFAEDFIEKLYQQFY